MVSNKKEVTYRFCEREKGFRGPLLEEGGLLQEIYGTLLSEKINMVKNSVAFSKSNF